jgi:prepilin-type N-terminal cleavage/methylation domain-containing protein
MMKKMHRQEGFTLIELMIVILIIGILVGIAVPVFLAARGNADKKACLSNQRNFKSASDILASETGYYPNAATYAVGALVGPAGDNTAVWPGGYYAGALDAQSAPVCPSGDGVVAVTYTNFQTAPTLNCAGAGGDANEHGTFGQ